MVAGGNDRILIDYTDFLLTDIHGVARRLASTKQGSYKIDKGRSAVYRPRSKAFADNTELEAIVTFNGTKPGQYVRQVAPDPFNLTVHMHHSFIRLPDDNYQPRTFHPFSGFWSVEVKDYATAIDAPMEQRFIPRHRLSKKNPNAARSEAVKPIVYYLDPGVPEPVRSALLDGARWWGQAFEAAGYINAYQVKVLPEGADPMDVRYNIIQWVHRATRGWSYGASVTDPRTGEIIKGHVSLGSLRVRQDLMIAQGLTAAFDGDPQKQQKAKEMALARIRQLSAHEVGHTLGIAHNFAASTNDRASVMDYPHPLVTLSRDGEIVLNDAYDDKIGEWDKHVVAYGYGDYGDNEAAKLQEIIDRAKAKGLRYMSDPDARSAGGAHPHANLWDNGKDAVEELARMIELRQKALEKFGVNAQARGAALSQLEEILVPVYLFHRYQIQGAAKMIAGLDYGYELNEGEQSKRSEVVSADKQNAAMQTILKTLDAQFLTLPADLIPLLPPKAYGESRSRESFKSRTGITLDAVSMAEVSARHSIALLLHPERLNRLQQQTAREGKGLTVRQVIRALFKQTIKAPQQRGLNNVVQQRVSNVAMELVMQQLNSDDLAPEVKALIYDEVMSLVPWLSNALKQSGNEHAGLHRLIKQQLIWFEQTGEWQSQFKLLPLPPGSPI